MEYFDQHLFDHVRNCHVGMVQDEIDEWQADIKAYIAQVEKDCDKYAYVRCNAWRKTVPDGEEYDIDPRDYCSEQEYLEAYQREKYRWRNRYSCRGVLGVNPNDYDSEDEFLQVLTVKRNEKRECELAERKRIREAENRRYAEQNDNAPETQDDKTIYRFCGVVFSQDNHPYHYRTEDKSIQVGDVVVVPAGNQEKEVTVVSVGDYMRMGAPYPVDKAKFILRKATRTNE